MVVLVIGTIECIVVVPANPCPQLFQYKVDDGGYYFGELEFPNDGSGDFVLEVNVSMVGFYRNKVLSSLTKFLKILKIQFQANWKSY